MVNKALINSQNQRINTIFSEPFYERFLMLFFVLFPLTSSINTLLPFSLNRFLMLFFVVIMFLREINGGCRSLKRWFLYGFLVLAFVYTSLKSLSNFTENAEDFIYFFVCCFAFVALTSKDLLESLFRIGQRNKTIYVSILIASLCLLFLSKLSPESYEKDGSFCGWMVSSHSVASTCILIFSVFIFLKVKNPLPYIYCSYFIFISNARTFLIPLAILLYFYLRIIVKKKMLRVFIVIISLVAAILIFPKTSMYEKFITTFNNQYAGDVFAGLSNGRTVFWAADLKSFIDDYSFAEKILGRGFSWIKDVNYSITGHRLWAHNDFINLLLSVGIFGLIVYFIVLIGFFRKIKNKKLLVFVLTFVFACALLNGFYLYFPLVASVVFIIHYQYIFPSCFWSEQAAC